jgi:hypothetical protein
MFLIINLMEVNMKYIKIFFVVFIALALLSATAQAMTLLDLLNASFDKTNARLRLVLEDYSSTASGEYYTDDAIATALWDGTDNGIAIAFTGGNFECASSACVFNEDSADRDFRIESDGSAAAFFVDGENDRVGIFVAAPGVAIDLAGAIETNGGTFTHNQDSGDYDFTIESNGSASAVFVDAGNDRVGIFNGAPAVPLDVTGEVQFDGGDFNINEDSGDFDFKYETDSTDKALFIDSGASTMETNGVTVTFNQGSADVDFVVESNSNANALTVDAGTDHVGIMNSNPRTDLDVTGSIRQSKFYWEDEFVVIDAPQWTTHVTTGSVAIQALAGGAERLTTGGTTTNEESLDWNDITTFVSTQRPYFEFQLDVEQITVIEFGIGLKESEGVGVDDYIKIMFDASAQNTVYLQASTGGVTTEDQGAVLDTDTHIYRVEWTSDTALEWFIDGVSQGVVASNVPTVGLQPTIEVFTEENGAHYIDIYYFKIWQDRT